MGIGNDQAYPLNTNTTSIACIVFYMYRIHVLTLHYFLASVNSSFTLSFSLSFIFLAVALSTPSMIRCVSHQSSWSFFFLDILSPLIYVDNKAISFIARYRMVPIPLTPPPSHYPMSSATVEILPNILKELFSFICIRYTLKDITPLKESFTWSSVYRVIFTHIKLLTLDSFNFLPLGVTSTVYILPLNLIHCNLDRDTLIYLELTVSHTIM